MWDEHGNFQCLIKVLFVNYLNPTTGYTNFTVTIIDKMSVHKFITEKTPNFVIVFKINDIQVKFYEIDTLLAIWTHFWMPLASHESVENPSLYPARAG